MSKIKINTIFYPTIYANKWFKNNNPDKRVMYITTMQSYDMFGNSWLLAPDLAYGEIMVRVDDDDILAEDALEFLSKTYEDNPELGVQLYESAPLPPLAVSPIWIMPPSQIAEVSFNLGKYI